VKRYLTYLFFILPIISNAVPLNQSFSSLIFPPIGWRAVNNDSINGGDYTWERFTSYPRTQPACASSKFEGSGIRNDDWLITSKLICSAQTPDTLKFWYRKYGAGGIRESLQVRLSTTGNAIDDFTTLLWVTSFSSTTYLQKIITLDAYDGQEIYIAFVNKGRDQSRINVDDITGPEMVEINDVGVDSILYPQSSFIVRPVGINFQPQARIRNLSNIVQRNIPVVCSILGQNSGLQYHSIKYVDSLLIDSSKAITFDYFTPTISETCIVSIKTLLANDTNPTNNQKTKVTQIIFGNYTGGPDAGFNYWIDSDTTGGPVYNWTDISLTGTQLPTGDINISWPISIGFTFNYYGEPKTYFCYSTNGFISFDTLTQSYNSNVPIQNSDLPNNILAPFWDDLYTMRARYQTFGSPPNRYTIVQWNALVFQEAVLRDTIVFQIIITENGDIVFQYNRCDNRYNLGQGQTATVGIENASGISGLQYLYNGITQGNLLTAGRAIRFYRSCHDVMPDSLINTQAGLLDTFTPSVLVKNIGTFEESFSTVLNIYNNAQNLIYADTAEITNLLPASNCVLDFRQWVPNQYGNNPVKIWTTLDNDFNRNNDTIFDEINVSLTAPILISPQNGSITNNRTLYFDWSDVLNATQYDFKILNYLDTICYNSQLGPIFLPEGSYYWQVRAGNQTLWGFWSQANSLIIDTTPPLAPILISPSSNCTLYQSSPQFFWYKNEEAVNYNLLIYTTTDTALNITLTDTFYSTTQSLANGSYFWKVRCQDQALNWSNFSLTRTFFITYPTWEQKTDIPVLNSLKPVYAGGCLTSAGDKIYALKGNNTRDFYSYDIAFNQWAIKCSVPYYIFDSLRTLKRKVKNGTSAISSDSLIFIVKGGVPGELWAYNTNNDSWIQKRPLREAKNLKLGTGLAYYNGYIYCLVGGSKYFEFYQYDINHDTWTLLNPAPAGSYNNRYRDGSSIVYGGDNKIYALKGRAHYNEFYVYDILTNSWEERESLPFSTRNIHRKYRMTFGGAMCCDGVNTIYAIKGGGRNEFWKYNTIADNWSSLETIPRLYKRSVPRSGAGITYADGRVWLLKGNKTFEFWVYNTHMDKTLASEGNIQQVQSCEDLGYQQNIQHSWKVINNRGNQNKALINFTISFPQNIAIRIYDAQGRLIQTMNKYLQAGNYSEEVYFNNSPKGVYFYTLETSR
jgi:hypothetical protein